MPALWLPFSPLGGAWWCRIFLPVLLSTLSAASAVSQSVALHLSSATERDSSQAILGETGADSAPAVTHLTVGHVLYLRSTKRIRRVYVANPETLSSYTVNPHQIVFAAKGAGLTSVGVWDEDDHVTTYSISADVPVQQLKDALKLAYPGTKIEVSVGEGHVLLSGTVPTAAIAEGVVKLAGSYAKDVVNSLVVSSSRIKQVRLHVRIVEVDRSKLTQFGINIFNPGGGGNTLAIGSAHNFPRP